MKNKWRILIASLAIAIFGTLIIFIRLILGGDEDTWICVGGQWVKYGNPSTSKPLTGCGENKIITSPPTAK